MHGDGVPIKGHSRMQQSIMEDGQKASDRSG
jgi:hypothetical protein